MIIKVAPKQFKARYIFEEGYHANSLKMGFFWGEKPVEVEQCALQTMPIGI